MDELLIDEKKYVSSKRAAKITGYAKDYIGQLCREGRVPARLVGRSWYVLESAITDHRFGAPPAAAHEPVKKLSAEKKAEEAPSTWELPRYEAITPDALPLSRSAREEEKVEVPEERAETQPEALLDSWRNWFDHVAEIEPELSVERKHKQEAEDAEQGAPEEPEEPEEKEQEAVEIPIRTVYNLPPQEIMPRSHPQTEEVRIVEERVAAPQPREARRGAYALFVGVRVAALLIALVALSLATVSTGYVDKYMHSFSQASVITGISTYEK